MLFLTVLLICLQIFKETGSMHYERIGRIMQYKQSPLSASTYDVEYQKCPNDICIYVVQYPHEDIRAIMSDKELLKKMFGSVLNSTFEYTIASRFGGPSTSLCDTEGSMTYRPHVMRNMNQKWKFIVNVDDYIQAFTSEMCRNIQKQERDSDWDISCTRFNFNCKQTYQDISLLAYDDGIIEMDKFLIPTTCECVCSSKN